MIEGEARGVHGRQGRMRQTGSTVSLQKLIGLLPRRLRRQKLLQAMVACRLASAKQVIEYDGGARAWVDLRDAESRGVFLSRRFWPEFYPLVAAFLEDGGDFFDVGANFGLVTFGLLSRSPMRERRCHLFEANREIVDCLEWSAGMWPGVNLVVNHCCVRERPGVSEFVNREPGWGRGHIGNGGASVPNLVLDDYIDRHGVEHVGFLKMDIEGSEALALQGCEAALRAGRVRAGFIEVTREHLRRTGWTAEALLRLIGDLGFDAYFCELQVEPEKESRSWARIEFSGVRMWLSACEPLPAEYEAGDVLILHRTSRIGGIAREALGRLA